MNDCVVQCWTFCFQGSLGGVSSLNGLSISGQTLVQGVDFPAYCNVSTVTNSETTWFGQSTPEDQYSELCVQECNTRLLTFNVFNVEILKLALDLAKQVKEVVA